MTKATLCRSTLYLTSSCKHMFHTHPWQIARGLLFPRVTQPTLCIPFVHEHAVNLRATSISHFRPCFSFTLFRTIPNTLQNTGWFQFPYPRLRLHRLIAIALARSATTSKIITVVGLGMLSLTQCVLLGRIATVGRISNHYRARGHGNNVPRVARVMKDLAWRHLMISVMGGHSSEA